ncbi:MAG: hypothetical protein IPK22_27370 [Verrucomicrobiaceae bacterium]|nr:hypothetical protein [Verrucomicrobiaceae bacterium]
MKTLRSIALILTASMLALITVSCNESKGPAAKVGDKIDDALDARPAEGVRDAVENITK